MLAQETVAQEVLEESGSDGDSDNDSDLEQARMFLERAEDEEAGAAEQKAFLDKGATASRAKMPDAGLFVHVVHRTAHRVGGRRTNCLRRSRVGFDTRALING